MLAPHLERIASSDRANRASDGGFTMIEAIVSLTVFVVIAVAATTAIVTGMNASTAARNRVNGTNVVQSDLEQARAQASPQPTAYSTKPAGGSISYSVTRTVTMPSASAGTACPAGSMIRISTVAGWAGSSQTVRAATVIAC